MIPATHSVTATVNLELARSYGRIMDSRCMEGKEAEAKMLLVLLLLVLAVQYVE
jgi:hypothetical protein